MLHGSWMAIALALAAPAQETGWRHSGSIFILTTPEGADLPASASVDGFPLLVRLHKDFFDFSQAKPGGEDLRFATSAGDPLPHQIEEWDAAGGRASLWVRIPNIKGNARQEIRLRWGRADARSESDGAAVFNASNGYLSVLHLDDPGRDETGALQPKDAGTLPAAGLIGRCRRFSPGAGINGGEKIAGLPSGAAPHSSQAWFRAETPNATVLGWGNEQAQGKVVLQFASPPHLKTDCYFSNGNVAGATRLSLSEWIHVVHTYGDGGARLYVNGRLDGSHSGKAAPLALKSPARLYLGGWYGQYRFAGEIDEARISIVARSADWVKLEYENQKPLQTLVGPILQPGGDFSLSPESLTVAEGRSLTVSARAGGAQKLYWILMRDGKESVVATDRLSYTFYAGRVTGDTACVLQFKAVHADGIRTRDVPVTIREEIPEPVFTLQAPADWNGRDPIEVVPAIRNLEALKAGGAADLRQSWEVSGGAVIKTVAAGRLLLQRSQYSGPITVKATIDNGGMPAAATREIRVVEPGTDPWVRRIPGRDEKPEDNQFYARDDRNEGTLHCNGTLDPAADEVFLKLYADDALQQTESGKPAADRSYAFALKLKPGLVKYRVELGTRTGSVETVLHRAGNLVCGDAYLIEGQSNALATDTREESPRETNDWVRSYAHPRFQSKTGAPNLWCNPVWKAQKEHKAELGWWGMDLARRLVESRKIPVFIVNGAVGGTRIDQHQRNDADPTDLNTIYGRMLWRVQQAKLTHGIRAVIWHQGESDQGADGPGGGYGWETWQRYFVEMSADWKQDFPNLRRYYLFQIWPDACSMGNGRGDRLREVQRTLPRLYSNMDVLSTLGIRPPGPCHYPLAGWSEFARMLQPLIERDSFGIAATRPLTPPNLRQARFANASRDSIELEFDQPVVWSEALAGQFYLDGAKDKVASGAASGNAVTLKLKESATARTITYLKETSWSQEKLLLGANGLAALTFCEVPIEAAR